MNKLKLLKTAILLLFMLLVVLLALAKLYENEILMIAGLLVFTAAAGLLTCYIVETQS